MLELNKKQIKEVISVLNSISDVRPALKHLCVQKLNNHNMLCLCDALMIVAYEVEVEDDKIDYAIKLDELIKWYKLSSSKDVIDINWINNNLVKISNYPRLDRLVLFNEDRKIEPISTIAVDASRLNSVQKMLCSDNTEHQCLNYIFTGSMKPIYLELHKSINFGLVLPLRTYE